MRELELTRSLGLEMSRDIALARPRTLWHERKGFSETRTWRNGRRSRLQWSAREETRGAEPPKFGES
jgi:hypothetical protein